MQLACVTPSQELGPILFPQAVHIDLATVSLAGCRFEYSLSILYEQPSDVQPSQLSNLAAYSAISVRNAFTEARANI